MRANAAIFDPSHPGRILMGGDLSYSSSFLRISTDLGATWSSGEDGLSGAVNTIVAVPAQPGLFYCGTAQGFFESTDGGLTWNEKGGLSAVQAIAVDTLNAGSMYAGTTYGAFFSSDGGDKWDPLGSSLPVNNILSLALAAGPSGALLAGTNGASAFSTAPLTGIGEQPGAKPGARPAQLSIEPNPSHGSVFIKLDHWTTGALDHSCVSIFDASGRCVRVLSAPQSLLPNLYSLSWDGRDQAGRPVQAGAYFVRTESGSSRLVLVR